MKNVIWLLLLVGGSNSFSDIKHSAERQHLELQNILKNPGFEQGMYGWVPGAGSGSALVTTATTNANVESGGVSVSLTPTGNSTFWSVSVPTPGGYVGRTCMFKIRYKGGQDVAVYTLRAIINAGFPANSTTNIPASTNWTTAVTYAHCGSAGQTMKLGVYSGSAAATIYLDSAYVGPAYAVDGWKDPIGDSSTLHKNFLRNPGAEEGDVFWAKDSGTLYPTQTAANVFSGKNSVYWSPPASNSAMYTVTQTVPSGLYGKNCLATFQYKGGASSFTSDIVHNGASSISSSTAIVASTYWTKAEVPFVCPTSGNVRIQIRNGSSTADFWVDDAYMGENYLVQPNSVNSSLELTNLGLSASVASNALTVALKTKSGADPSAGDPVKIAFRDPTITTGNYVQRTATAATSLVISSGSTLGHVAAAVEYIYVFALDNAGVIELAASSSPAYEQLPFTTTAEGGAGAADSPAVHYSTTARTSKSFRLIGRITISEATAGTWASAPLAIELAPFTVPVAQSSNRKSNSATAGVGGIAVSASSGAFSTTSTSLVDVTNLAVTLTTSGRPVQLMIISDGSTPETGWRVANITNPHTSNIGNLRYLRDGATTVAYWTIKALFPSVTTNTVESGFPLPVVDPVPAGTYAYKVQIDCSVSTAFCTSAALDYQKLVAFEL